MYYFYSDCKNKYLDKKNFLGGKNEEFIAN